MIDLTPLLGEALFEAEGTVYSMPAFLTLATPPNPELNTKGYAMGTRRAPGGMLLQCPEYSLFFETKGLQTILL